MTRPIAHVVLDRDGVLNRPVEGWLASVDEWVWERGALAGLARLAVARVRVSIATNQSGIGRGTVTEAEVGAVHRWLAEDLRRREVDLVGIFCCPHAPGDGCRCRKPRPLLVEEAVLASGVPAAQAVLVGDSVRDIQAAHAVGVGAVLVGPDADGRGTAVELAGVGRAADLDEALAGLGLPS